MLWLAFLPLLWSLAFLLLVGWWLSVSVDYVGCVAAAATVFAGCVAAAATVFDCWWC